MTVMSRQQFTAWLQRRVASRAPTAVVRLGDGETRLLRAHPDDAASMEAAKVQIQMQAGGDPGVEQIVEIKAALERARDEADVLGILGRSPFDTRQVGDRKADGVMKTLRAVWPRREAPDEPPMLADRHLHHNLLDPLPGMLAGRKVSVISCRDVRPVIEAKWGVDNVAVYQLPSEYMTRDFDSAYEVAMHEVPIWPDAHQRVVDEMAVREPGEVFLVGGGPFCKDLCVRVRDRGGIGLDLGSTLDHVAGRLVRSGIRRLFELEATGMSASEIALRLGEILDVPVDSERVEELIDSVSLYVR